jgi:hypothetical protein
VLCARGYYVMLCLQTREAICQLHPKAAAAGMLHKPEQRTKEVEEVKPKNSSSSSSSSSSSIDAQSHVDSSLVQNYASTANHTSLANTIPMQASNNSTNTRNPSTPVIEVESEKPGGAVLTAAAVTLKVGLHCMIIAWCCFVHLATIIHNHFAITFMHKTN